MNQFVCMNWGDAYGPDYVNRLYGMIARNTTQPFRLICYTDNRDGIDSRVECYDCPEVDIPSPKRNRGWRKLALWNSSLPGLKGRALFLDLDVVITGSLDDFFAFEPMRDFCVIHNWTHPDRLIGNTSVYRFDVGSHPQILNRFLADHQRILTEFANSQSWVSHVLRDSITFWPDDWCLSFKRHCVPRGPRRWWQPPLLPTGARIVAFPGQPNPHDAVAGHWPAPWYKRTYKHIRPSGWVQEHWRA